MSLFVWLSLCCKYCFSINKQKKAKKSLSEKIDLPYESHAAQTQDDYDAFFEAESIERRQEIKDAPKRSVIVRGGEIRKTADSYLGTPYLYGGVTNKGFDCSGFAWRVFQDLGYTDFPRESAQSLYNDGRTVSRNSLREGFVFLLRPEKAAFV